MSSNLEEVQNLSEVRNGQRLNSKLPLALRHVEKIRVAHLVFNIITTILFIVGSFGWVFGFAIPGTFMFAGGNILMTGTLVHGVIISMVEFRTGRDTSGPAALTVGVAEQAKDPHFLLHKFEVESALTNAAGCIIFTIGCFVSVSPPCLVESDLLYLLGSICFLFGSINFQILAGSFWGNFTPVWVVRIHDPQPVQIFPFICGRVMNTIGSILFTFGSLVLFFAKTVDQGGWWYGIGSIAFFLAAWGDFTDYVLVSLPKQKRDGMPLSHSAIVEV